MQATFLGAGMFADAFSLSFKLANIMRKLFAEGAFNASFLPIFSNALNDSGKEEAEKIASQIFTWLVLMISLFMILVIIFYREIITFYAGGIDQTSEKFAHLVVIGRINSPYIATSFLAALFGGILNTLNRYAMPAAVQICLNIALVIALVTGPLCFPSTAYTMAYATLVAGAVQVLLLWYNVKKCSFSVGFNFSPVKDAVKVFFKKLVSGAVGAGFWQLNIVIDFAFLTFLPTGAIAYFYYTDHVNQFPIGILGIAFSTALLPPLTSAIHKNDTKKASEQMNLGLMFALMFTLPATVLLVLLSEEVTNAIYGHGNFTLEHVVAAAPALEAFALGLPTYMATKVFSAVFFANRDTRTPLIGGMISIVTNILMSIILMPIMKHTGIALATTLSAWLNCLYLMYSLKKIDGIYIDSNTKIQCLKQVFVSIMAGLAIIAVQKSGYLDGLSKQIVWGELLLGCIVFWIVGKICGIFKFLDNVKNI